jgi:hypothetical protein
MKNNFTLKNIILSSFLLIYLLIPANVNAQANVYVNPPTTILSGSDTVTVDFMISNVSDLHSYKVSFLFDNSIIDFENIVKGPFLTNGSYSTALFITPSIIADSINVEEAILGPYSVNGSGKLFSTTLKILSAGTSSINIVDVQLRDLANQSIPVTWTSGDIIVPVSVNIKAFLQGPFDINAMTTSLNLSGNLPLIQPYSGFPWNYGGTESVIPGFFSSHPNIVDWVLVELRTDISAATAVDRKAGFITNIGNVVSIDGESLLYFTQPGGDYHVLIYHRNHIPIMSSGSTTLDYISLQYDFTDSQSKAYGLNAMINLGGGYFGLPTGDSDGSRTVDAADRSNTWNQRNLSGYFGTDVDLSGTVDAVDRSLIWNNRNLSTQVPN